MRSSLPPCVCRYSRQPLSPAGWTALLVPAWTIATPTYRRVPQRRCRIPPAPKRPHGLRQELSPPVHHRLERATVERQSPIGLSSKGSGAAAQNTPIFHREILMLRAAVPVVTCSACSAGSARPV